MGSRNVSVLSEAADTLSQRVSRLRFSPPVHFVYNPLEYARGPHLAYLEKYARKGVQVLLVGMNPGPFGMAQTGVPFGEVGMVRDWLRISGDVTAPKKEHAKRKIEGFSCVRKEVSGQRLWGWAQKRYGSPEKFFKDFFVTNYCPLVFMEESGRNFTPDKLPSDEQAKLFAACDENLRAVVDFVRPKMIVGVGAFAEQRIIAAVPNARVGRVLHPSPASPLANKDWPGQAERALVALGVALPE